MSVVATGQPEPRLQEIAPPPLKTISRFDRAQINEADDSKSRVKTTIKLAEVQLTAAEEKTSQHDYEAAAVAMGMYWGLIDDAFVFMKTLKADSNKARDLYKRIELSLRAHGPRLATIRRSTPAEYSVWIKEIEEFARSGRTEALNSFYGHTVVHDGQKKSPATKPQEKPTP